MTPLSFWSNLNRTDSCWLWKGSLTKCGGYGQLAINGQRWRAPRLAYTLAVGDIPPGLVVRHKCDTPACCRPDHLEIGSQVDNSNDCTERRRRRIGSQRTQAKLTEEAVRQIWRERGITTMAELGRRYGVTYVAIRQVYRGLTWTHVDHEE